MPGPNEMRLNLIDGVEYITLRADDFRTTMRVSDAVHKAELEALRAKNEQLRAAAERLQAYADGHPCDHMPACRGYE